MLISGQTGNDGLMMTVHTDGGQTVNDDLMMIIINTDGGQTGNGGLMMIVNYQHRRWTNRQKV